MGTQLPLPQKGGTAPNFRPMSIVPKRLDGSRCTWYGGRPRPRPHCARLEPAPLPRKGGTAPTIFGPCLLWPNGRMDQDATWYKDRPQPRPHCVTWGPSSPPIRGTAPKIFGRCLLWPNDRPPQLLLSTCPLGYENVHTSGLSIATVVRALFMGHMRTTG